MTELQRKAARPKCSRLFFKYKKTHFVLDDESYFTLSNTTLAGNDRFYSDNVQNTPYDVKNKLVAKYEDKLLVWIAISQNGISKPLFFKSGLAINQHVYKNQCLTNGLLPFINKYHKRDKYVFWPDLASSHYAKSVLEFLNYKNVAFVPKYLNPANVPKVRPIEDFWGLLKQKVYENDWKAKNIQELRKRITWCLCKIDKKKYRIQLEAPIKDLIL